MKRFSLAKRNRLLHNKQFKAVIIKGQRFSDDLLTVFIAQNSIALQRLGISIKKSVANAVLRNRLKRLIREAFRLNKTNIPQSYDYVIMISYVRLTKTNSPKSRRKQLKNITFYDVQNSLLKIIKQAQKSLKKT